MNKKSTAAERERMSKAIDCMHVMDWEQYQMMEDAKIRIISLIAITEKNRKLDILHPILVRIEKNINKAMDWSE